MKDGLVRADTLPLVFRVPGTESLPRGTRVRTRVAGIDLLTLDLHAQFVQRIDDVPAAIDDAATEADDESEASGPLTLAIDLGEADPTEPGAPGNVDAQSLP
jgi:exoribonuclease-2